MIRTAWLTFGFLLQPCAIIAQDDPEEIRIPVVGRPAEFYGGIGTGVKVHAKVEPPRVTTDQWITFALTLQNLQNAEQVEKPKLSKLDEFTQSFQVDDQPPDPAWNPAMPDQRIWIYRLRPRSTSVMAVPPLTYRYFDPKRPILDSKPELRFPSAWTQSIPIVVEKPTDPPPQTPVALSVPSFAEQVPDSSRLRERATTDRWPWIGIIAILVGPPILAGVWWLIWRRVYPDRARLARLLRSRAARKAWTALEMAQDSTTVAEVVLQYLRTRFDLPVGAITPKEVADSLPPGKFEGTKVQNIANLFRRCDSCRYSGLQEPSVTALSTEASHLISELEAEG